MYTDAPDAPLAVEVDATAVVTRGPHAGATGTVESVGNGWIRLRTADGRVVAARGREAVGAGARRDRVRRHFNVSSTTVFRFFLRHSPCAEHMGP